MQDHYMHDYEGALTEQVIAERSSQLIKVERLDCFKRRKRESWIKEISLEQIYQQL